MIDELRKELPGMTWAEGTTEGDDSCFAEVDDLEIAIIEPNEHRATYRIEVGDTIIDDAGFTTLGEAICELRMHLIRLWSALGDALAPPMLKTDAADAVRYAAYKHPGWRRPFVEKGREIARDFLDSMELKPGKMQIIDEVAGVEINLKSTEYMCADCEKPVASMDPCPHCGSLRTIMSGVLDGFERVDPQMPDVPLVTMLGGEPVTVIDPIRTRIRDAFDFEPHPAQKALVGRRLLRRQPILVPTNHNPAHVEPKRSGYLFGDDMKRRECAACGVPTFDELIDDNGDCNLCRKRREGEP